MEKSIYEIIKAAVGGDGLLPRDFSLPESGSEARIRFAPGAMDGIMMFHSCIAGNSGGGEYEQLCGIIELASEGKTEEAAAEADSFAVKGHVLSNIDILQDYIIEQKDRLDARRLYDFAVCLTAGASKAEAVKIGMTIMELFNTDGNEEFKKCVRTLALCDEFTLYAAYLMRGWSNSNEEFFEAVKKVNGWGRIFLVNSFLEADSEEKELWLLQNGVCNEVLPNYSAIDCYRNTHLDERLQKPMSQEEYRGAALIVDALLDDEPEPGISSIEAGAGVLELFLERSAEADYVEAEDYGVIYRIREYARGSFGTESDVYKRAEAILSEEKVCGLIKSSLADGRATELARNLGIDYKEAAFRTLERDFESNYTTAALLIQDNYKLDDVLRLVWDGLEVNKIGTGSADEIGGKEFVNHGKLSYLIQFLEAYPGKGMEILKQMLRSPVVNNRFTALRVISGWTKRTGKTLKEFEPQLCQYISGLLPEEVTENVREEMKKLIK